MKCSVLVIAVALALGEGSVLRGPIFSGKVDNNAQFASSAQDGKPARSPGYRSAWDDCGGVGASATERMRSIASKIKGWAKPLPFVRHAAQDCGTIAKSGTKPGPGKMIVFPGPEIPATIRDGLSTAAKTLAKYPAFIQTGSKADDDADEEADESDSTEESEGVGASEGSETSEDDANDEAEASQESETETDANQETDADEESEGSDEDENSEELDEAEKSGTETEDLLDSGLDEDDAQIVAGDSDQEETIEALEGEDESEAEA